MLKQCIDFEIQCTRVLTRIKTYKNFTGRAHGLDTCSEALSWLLYTFERFLHISLQIASKNCPIAYFILEDIGVRLLTEWKMSYDIFQKNFLRSRVCFTDGVTFHHLESSAGDYRLKQQRNFNRNTLVVEEYNFPDHNLYTGIKTVLHCWTVIWKLLSCNVTIIFYFLTIDLLFMVLHLLILLHGIPVHHTPYHLFLPIPYLEDSTIWELNGMRYSNPHMGYVCVVSGKIPAFPTSTRVLEVSMSR